MARLSSSDGLEYFGGFVNWLAHAVLSSSDTDVRLGNLLADIVKGPLLNGMSPGFLQGVQRHQAIDRYTDGHPVVHRSKSRISGAFRHTTGILTDVFYDHFLSIHWDLFVDEPIDEFIARIYADMSSHPVMRIPETNWALQLMISENWLGSYGHLDGIELTLRRVSRRLLKRTGRQFELEKGITELVTNFEGLQSDFAEFFPDLMKHLDKRDELTAS